MSRSSNQIKNIHKVKYVIAKVFFPTLAPHCVCCSAGEQSPVSTRRLLTCTGMRRKCRIERSQRHAHIMYCCFFVLVFTLASLFIKADAGNAQEPTPSATSDGETSTPTATLEIIETGTTAPAVLSESKGESEAEQTIDEGESRASDSSSRILVTISPGAKILKVIARVSDHGNVIEMEELSKLGVFMMDVASENLAEKMEQIKNISGVLYVEPDYPVQAEDTFPDDPGFVNQYALISIHAPQGWDLSTGSTSITIAILDSGADLGHVDLVSKLVAGFDFVNNDSVPQDDYGHGTHVAGIAAASGNNGAGIAGVSWGARVMPVKVLNSSGGGSYSNVAAGIVWAVDNGAHVINMSFGGVAPSVVLQNAVTYAYNNNVLMAASSGNTGSSFVLYPARYPEVMAVGASNMSDQPASFSNYGPEVDIAAPGENIYSLWPGGYSIQTGTSMSAPHVSGLAAVLFGYLTSADSVRSVIESTALDVGPAGWDLYSGAGLIQMDVALMMVVPPTATATLTLTLPSGGGGGSLSLPGFLPILLSPSPAWTASPLSSPTFATSTQTFTPLGQTPTLTPSLTPTITSTPMRDIIPLWENKIERLKIFLSPYFCCAFLMILSGLWLFWRGTRFGGRKGKFHNKIVM